jgi:hypothetical protein
MDAEDDVMAAMARELVEKGRVGESADAICGEPRRECRVRGELGSGKTTTFCITGSFHVDSAALPMLTLSTPSREAEG